MTRKRRRLYIVLMAVLCLGAATALVMTAFEDNLLFFYSPSDVKEKGLPEGRMARLGGLVAEGSVEQQGGTLVTFAITDGPNTLNVVYDGILPDLFREGQGVVAEGMLQPDGRFRAVEVLAKHDENYMPPEVAEALKKSGEWRPEEGSPPAGAIQGASQ
ncbi:cytochrome c maturation protein CcmE [Rhodovibrionaceae bacterium A322]